MGFNRSRGGAAGHDSQGRGLFDHRADVGRHFGCMVHQLQSQQRADRANRTGRKKYLADAGPYAKETLIGDHDLHKVLPLLNELRNMPAGYAVRRSSTPMAAGFGLSQRERLQSSSENAYRVALERLFRPRLLFRLEEQLDAKDIDPGFFYEALKVYMMLGGQHPADSDLIKSWMRRDWAENLYPGASNAEGRKLLEAQLDAMLDLETGSPLIELNGRLIEESQKTPCPTQHPAESL